MQARRARRSPGASTDTSDRSSPWDHAIGARIRGCLRRRVIRATRADRRGTPPCRPRRLTTGRRRRRLTTGRRPRQRRTGQVVRVAVSFSWLNDNGWSCRGRAAEGERPDDAPPSEYPPGSGSICPATVGTGESQGRRLRAEDAPLRQRPTPGARTSLRSAAVRIDALI